MTAKLVDVRRVLDEGGYVEFIWNRGGEWLVSSGGARIPLDGRTYQGCLATVAPNLTRTETGGTENKDLTIVWRKR